MKLSPFAIRFILVLMFLFAVGLRISSTSESRYPYFKGESAMNYRDALNLAESGSGGLDQLTKKSNWPEGYHPARIRPAGVEYFAGAALRTATWFSDADTRKIARRLVAFCFSLCVFTLFALTRNLWQSQAAGLLAAALAAFFPPLIDATSGREFSHTPFALVLVTIHILALQRFTRGSRWLGSAGIVLTTFALVVAWELTPYYLAACVLIATLLYPLAAGQRRFLTGVHLLVFLAAVVFSPHTRASGAVFSWQPAFLAACFAYTFAPARLRGAGRGAAFILTVTALLTLALTPFRAGAETFGLPALEYAYHRIRFLFAKPVAPSLLPETIRQLWSTGHACPSAHSLLVFFLPFVFLLPAGAAASRRLIREERAGTTARTLVVLAAATAVLGMSMFAIDRSAVSLASVAAFPFIALTGRSLERRARIPAALAAAGLLLVVLQLVSPLGRANPTLRLARALGVDHRDNAQIVWVSLENTDRELVRFVATRTSTRDPFLGDPEVTALLLAFSGRTSVLLAGGRSSSFARKRVDLTSLMYGSEDKLFLRCREQGIRYVLYSTDIVLDSTRYSPLYLAGLTAIPEDCVAVSMQFSPESLGHFNLVYENDRYRLFKVVDTPEPLFITDHPPVYQRDILERSGESYGTFRNRINFLLMAYIDATNAAAAGDFETARRGLMQCLQQAPGFTRARVALGKTLLDMGLLVEAREVLMSAMQYAPDNPEALYYAAEALARSDETEKAKALLEILYTTTYDKDLLNRARLLEAIIERDTRSERDGDGSDSAPERR